MIQYLEKNTKGKDYFVGDIHGCYDTLMAELSKIEFNYETDRLISVGDLVDRGSQSEDCLRLVLEPWFFAVLGNHEDMMIKTFHDEWSRFNYSQNGGDWFLNLYTGNQDALVKIAETMPLAIQVETDIGTIGVMHANAPDDWKSFANNTVNVEDIIWGRSRINYYDTNPVKNIDYVIVGHTPMYTPTVLSNIIYIDTGAVYNGNLTVVSTKEIKDAAQMV